MTLPRRSRLRRGSDIRRVFDEGLHVVNPRAALYGRMRCDGPSRVTVVTGRRLGGAVVRNRLRRLFKECYRQYSECVKPGYDLVFVVRRTAVGADLSLIGRTVVDLLRRAQIWQEGKPGC